MTHLEMNDFIDSVTREDCTVRFRGRIYLCLGMAKYPDGKYHAQVLELNEDANKWVRDLLMYDDKDEQVCIKHFLEDKYWDGKSFYEVASEMEWID